MTQAPPPARPPKAPPRSSSADDRAWYEKISRTRYFFGALFLHVIVFFLVATMVIFPAFKPPQEDFNKTYVPPGGPPPPPPPPPDQTVQVPTTAVAQPSTTITSSAPTSFSVVVPDITPATTPIDQQTSQPKKIEVKPNTVDEKRLASIMHTENNWGRDRNNILESGGDPHNVKATFPVYLASYADGDWNCNIWCRFNDGKITSGSLPNLVAKINEWSHGNITGSMVPEPLDIGGPDLMAKTPPFIFFTGHKDFHLTDQEVQNLRDYLQVGGMIWGDSALAGFGSRFDVAFHREMKRVVPDIDKNFQPVDPTSEIFTKSWFTIAKLPPGMNYYAEPIQHLDIDGKLAILYTPNDYSDMFTMRILPGDTQMSPVIPPVTPPYLFTDKVKWDNSQIFFRNYDLPSCLACDQLGMNIVAYALVRFDKDLLLAPP